MAVSSHGTLLKIGDGASPEVFTTIAEVLDISGPGMSLSTDVWRTDDIATYAVVPTGFDPDEVTFDVNYTGDGTQGQVREAIATQALTSFRIELPTVPAETLAFTGYITRFRFSEPVDGVLQASVIVTLASAMTTV